MGFALLLQICEKNYNIPVSSMQIYLRSDYTPLHIDNENSDNVKKN